ncbi:hypothetical protein MTP99_009209 [Tenebrio molitor]|jgi:hypothetical protein|nr:hypothetical protein MTP99_009209 [Tenebrio molitor]
MSFTISLMFLFLTTFAIIQGDPSCPETTGDDPVFLPASDCTQYYQCEGDIPQLMECPDGLHFNPTLSVCDWASEAGCADAK